MSIWETQIDLGVVFWDPGDQKTFLNPAIPNKPRMIFLKHFLIEILIFVVKKDFLIYFSEGFHKL
jgi:hypothetical protein